MPVIDLGRVIGPQGPQGAQGAQGQRGEQGFPGPNIVGGDTATTLTGVLVGNGNVVGTRAIDAAPTANSNGFATSGGTKAALDTKAHQEQLGPVETGATASVRHEVGTCFCWNGLLYRTTVDIDVNDPITPGTNCIISTASQELLPRTFGLYSSTLLDIHGGATFTFPSDVPACGKYRYIILRMTLNDSDSSSSRGILMLPIAGANTGPYIAVVVGGQSGWIRYSVTSNDKSFRIVDTSFASLYLASAYGIM